jgi:hypothetical protein
MASNKLPHRFLKNPSSRNIGFKKTRNFANDEEEIDDPKNYVPQKEELKDLHRIFNIERRDRHQKRTLEVPDHIDLVKIQFFVSLRLTTPLISSSYWVKALLFC